MDPVKEVCKGCYRTRKEIAQWPSMDGAAQRQLLEALKQRRAEQTGIAPKQNARQNANRLLDEAANKLLVTAAKKIVN
jgi:predicted Fe-S protein YdhL (DUF1289 family)